MASPVIIDDGGSTRIKKLVRDGQGTMNSLLDVNMQRTPADSTEMVGGPYTHIKGLSIDQSGDPTVLINEDLISGDSFEIASDNGQAVSGAIDAGSRCTITVHGSPGNPPLIEAKQFRGRRRYVVANAGPIKAIEGTVNGKPVSVAVHSEHAIYTTFIIS